MNALVILRYKSSIIVKDMQSDDGRAHDWIKFFRSFVLSMIGIGCPSYEIGGLERRSFFGAYGSYGLNLIYPSSRMFSFSSFPRLLNFMSEILMDIEIKFDLLKFGAGIFFIFRQSATATGVDANFLRRWKN